ncbi:uncharacterized protein BDZ99DRAFT_548222 [Mytilinidion resinicola]|uniref:Uncharacterized protein n=1 Tax=Mytilinidion resinicola TaxID=574789 RepID=A0A6A6Y2A2_9PEZI|nr:uncharacterized protein BDZ99DRAFT_548222 [Mytilinidion resinicola]KAF2802941.1 hypothetical protein BDZ99DRAFT_548222 [Mytilinidion resinicola]
MDYKRLLHNERSLRSLDIALSHACVSALAPPLFQNLSSLKVLNLTILDQRAYLSLPGSFPTLPLSLEQLCIIVPRGLHAWTTADFSRSMIGACISLPRLRTLDLRENMPGVLDMLSRCVNFVALKSLALWHLEQIASFLYQLKNNFKNSKPQLTYLAVSEPRSAMSTTTDPGFLQSLNAFLDCFQGLAHLHVCTNGDFAGSLRSFIRHGQTLKTLGLFAMSGPLPLTCPHIEQLGVQFPPLTLAELPARDGDYRAYIDSIQCLSKIKTLYVLTLPDGTSIFHHNLTYSTTLKTIDTYLKETTEYIFAYFAAKKNCTNLNIITIGTHEPRQNIMRIGALGTAEVVIGKRHFMKATYTDLLGQNVSTAVPIHS